MQVVCLTDQHFMYKKSSKVYFDYQMKFYNNVLFPYLKEQNITTIFDLGDTTDNRKSLDLDGIYRMKREYYDKLVDYEIHTIVGNHQTFYRDQNFLNTPDLILKEYQNIQVYSESTTVNINGRSIDIIPWINKNNSDATLDFINNSKSEIALGHLEVNGATLIPGHICTNGISANIFRNYTKILSGHLHFRHQYANVNYIGNTQQLNRGDEGAIRGFAILDTNTLQVDYVNNPYQLFKTIYYNDRQKNYNDFDATEYTDTFTRLIVEHNSDMCMYDVVVSKLYTVVYELKIIEQAFTDKLDYSDTIDPEQQDTIALFSEYLDEMNTDNKDELKSIVRGIHAEATI